MARLIAIREADLQRAETALESTRRALLHNATAMARYRSGVVVAERDGYVVRILRNEKNRVLEKGERVLLFAPEVTRRALRMKVGDFNMPLLRKGLKARVIFYGWPALQISGWPVIRYGSDGAEVTATEYGKFDKSLYYAILTETKEEPWPDPSKLRIGTRATVWVLLESVPIWYQLWRLMNALPPDMPKPPEKAAS
ncbi:hypothetical protein [Hydrogenimonas sp.]